MYSNQIQMNRDKFDLEQPRKTIKAFGVGLTAVDRTQEDDSKGNIYTNAPPPWLTPAAPDPGETHQTIGPDIEQWEKHKKFQKKSLLNPDRVGAKFDHNTEQSPSWLPSFGGVWHHTARQHSVKKFNKHEKRKGFTKQQKKSASIDSQAGDHSGTSSSSFTSHPGHFPEPTVSQTDITGGFTHNLDTAHNISQPFPPNTNVSQNSHGFYGEIQNGHHNASTSQNFHQNASTSQNFHHNASTSQNFHNNVSTSQNFHHFASTSQNFHNNSSTSQNFPHNASTSQNFHHNASTSQNFHHNASTSQSFHPSFEMTQNTLNNMNRDWSNNFPGNSGCAAPSVDSPFNSDSFHDSEMNSVKVKPYVRKRAAPYQRMKNPSYQNGSLDCHGEMLTLIATPVLNKNNKS